MVKGTSRQVIVVQGPEQKLFEQAIFILKDGALGEGITDDVLLREARQAIRGAGESGKKWYPYLYRAAWAGSGALAMGLLWALTVLL